LRLRPAGQGALSLLLLGDLAIGTTKGTCRLRDLWRADGAEEYRG
jgi:hypothetical protein